jgi:hypothetical protein
MLTCAVFNLASQMKRLRLQLLQFHNFARFFLYPLLTAALADLLHVLLLHRGRWSLNRINLSSEFVNLCQQVCFLLLQTCQLVDQLLVARDFWQMFVFLCRKHFFLQILLSQLNQHLSRQLLVSVVLLLLPDFPGERRNKVFLVEQNMFFLSYTCVNWLQPTDFKV